MRHKTSAIFMKFHEAKDCGILFVFLLRSTHILITKSHSRWPLSKSVCFLMSPRRKQSCKFLANISISQINDDEEDEDDDDDDDDDDDEESSDCKFSFHRSTFDLSDGFRVFHFKALLLMEKNTTTPKCSYTVDGQLTLPNLVT